ncbi:putative phage abortive infection protein [Paenibacillus sp. FJAT-26967]|uniref:putative phage abortive infection protein n=1 Tax=Paenibacillus sp. FJAT-26967 TaxID=1729690 RepID=UPI000838F89B|nr:putative phage abortive infection protein [Paenibacillus sp. FJAT-26967]
MWGKLRDKLFVNESDSEPTGKLIRFGVLMIIPVILWFVAGIVTMVSYRSVPDGPGTFGDMFGSVNALFSGMALAGIVYTIFIQKKEFQLQREELKLQREESKLTREVFVTQRFETTFFNLINLHHDLVKGLSYQKLNDGNFVSGREIFLVLLEEITDDFENYSVELKKDLIENFYNRVFKHLEHYLRNLFRIIDQIEEDGELAEEKKQQYYYSLNAQITSSEKIIIFYIILFINRSDFAISFDKVVKLEEYHDLLFYENDKSDFLKIIYS